MHVWHHEVDTPRRPERVSSGQPVIVCVGSWPIAMGQSVWACIDIKSASGRRRHDTRKGRWCTNEPPNSYWEIDLGRFAADDQISYRVLAEDGSGLVVATRRYELQVERSRPTRAARHVEVAPGLRPPGEPSGVEVANGALRRPLEQLAGSGHGL